MQTSDMIEYARQRAKETGRAYLIHGWVDADGGWHRKVIPDFPGNRRMIETLGETIFLKVTP